MSLLHLLFIMIAGLTTVTRAQSRTATAPVPGAPAGMMAFVDVGVVPMDVDRVLLGQTVLVQQGRIIALGPAKKVKVPEGAVRIDGRGQYLIPGLADMHAHLYLPTDSVYLDRRLTHLLARGVTTIREPSPTEDLRTTVLPLRDPILAGEVVGPRIYASGRWRINSRSGHFWASGPKDKLEDIAPQIEAYKAAGYDFIKVYS